MKLSAIAALALIGAAAAEPQRMRTVKGYQRRAAIERRLQKEEDAPADEGSMPSSMSIETDATAAPGTTAATTTSYIATSEVTTTEAPPTTSGATTTEAATTTGATTTSVAEDEFPEPELYASMSMSASMSIKTDAPTRSPLAEGQTRDPSASPTPEPTRSPLAEGETHSPTTLKPTVSPTEMSMTRSGAYARGTAASVIVGAAGALFFA